MAKKNNTLKKNNSKNENEKQSRNTQPETKVFVLIPIDALVRINASEAIRASILSTPWFCRAYLDCMELVPDAHPIVAYLRGHAKDIDVILESQYDKEIVEAIACKFHIPYVGIRCVEFENSDTSILKVNMRLKKLAS